MPHLSHLPASELSRLAEERWLCIGMDIGCLAGSSLVLDRRERQKFRDGGLGKLLVVIESLQYVVTGVGLDSPMPGSMEP